MAGFTGQPRDPATSSSGIWHEVGAGIATGTAWSAPHREELLEATLAGVYADLDAPQALDHLPLPLRDFASAVAELTMKAAALADDTERRDDAQAAMAH